MIAIEVRIKCHHEDACMELLVFLKDFVIGAWIVFSVYNAGKDFDITDSTIAGLGHMYG